MVEVRGVGDGDLRIGFIADCSCHMIVWSSLGLCMSVCDCVNNCLEQSRIACVIV